MSFNSQYEPNFVYTQATRPRQTCGVQLSHSA